MNKLLNTENLSRLWSSIIIDQIEQNDALLHYCAPGMRNAPILAAMNSGKGKTISFLDERALAFRALGSCKNGALPTLTCTSGTAVANFLPAVIEAYRSNLPMIILSADRPLELVKTDANQTIDQTKIFGPYVCDSLYLDAPSLALSPRRLRALIQNTINKAIRHRRPVHINIPLREPLYKTSEEIPQSYIDEAQNNSERINKYHISHQFSADEQINDLLASAKNPILVVGKIDNDINESELSASLKQIQIPKYIDVTSKIKYSFTLEDNIIPSFDHPEVYETFSKNRPDLIIHIGGRLVGKHYYRFQEEHPSITVLHITNFDNHHDPGFANNDKLICDPTDFINYLVKKNIKSKAHVNWHDFVAKKREVIDESPLSSAFISKSIIENSNDKLSLLIGNSTAIRSFDNFIHPNKSFELKSYHNRGVSGIEGFNATLNGIIDSEEEDRDFCLVIGDVSFKHDLNSLYMLNQIKDKSVKIVIINDFGGGIFKLLPVRNDEYIDLLTTPHDDEFATIVSSFANIDYIRVDKKEDFIGEINKSEKRVKIVEVIIEEKTNLEIFDKLRTIKI